MTYILMFALLGGLLAVSRMQAKRPSPQLKMAQTGLLLLTALILAVQGVRGCGSPPTFTSAQEGFERAAGYRLGKVIANDTPGEGSVLVLQWQGTSGTSKDNVEAQLEGLREGLAESALKLVLEGPVFPTGEEAMEKMLLSGVPVKEEDVDQWIAQSEDLVAIIAFMDIPALLNPRKLQGLPPVYLKGMSMHRRLELLVNRGFLRGVVVDKSNINVAEEAPRGLSPEELFEMRFEWVGGSDTNQTASAPLFIESGSVYAFVPESIRTVPQQRTLQL